jgi:predicted regulator of Ras-like GTPase activity (Roadblock/LC7/MglB family)
MMNYKLKNQPERIQQELKALADRIPEILSVGLITPDGLKLGFYSKDPRVHSSENSENEEEGSIGPMGAAITSLSERISSRLGAGEWTFSVIAGKKGIIFEQLIQLVNEEVVIIAIAQPESSIDAILPELKATCERLLQL